MMTELAFRLDGMTAIGKLCSGKQFRIDASDIERVSSISWRVNKDGYVAHYDHLMASELLLHRWLMDVYDPGIIVDHANRDRLDCRRSNLRIVTPAQNSANHSFFKTNKTGYTGVYYSKYSGRYEVKIGYRHRRILLGSTKDEGELETLAQMYNIGAYFFFGEYAGALNAVPEPSDLYKVVTQKCQKYTEKPTLTSSSVYKEDP